MGATGLAVGWAGRHLNGPCNGVTELELLAETRAMIWEASESSEDHPPGGERTTAGGYRSVSPAKYPDELIDRDPRDARDHGLTTREIAARDRGFMRMVRMFARISSRAQTYTNWRKARGNGGAKG